MAFFWFEIELRTSMWLWLHYTDKQRYVTVFTRPNTALQNANFHEECSSHTNLHELCVQQERRFNFVNTVGKYARK